MDKDKEEFTVNRFVSIALFALLLFALPVLALADTPVLLVDLPESAQMVESIEFENGDFIQTYQLEGGVTVQLLRYTGFAMTMDELIASDWPVNSGVEMQVLTEVSGYPAQHVHILQGYDEEGYPVRADGSAGGVMAIDLVLVTVEDTTLIYQSIEKGEQGAGDAVKTMIQSLKVQGAQSAEVG